MDSSYPHILPIQSQSEITLCKRFSAYCENKYSIDSYKFIHLCNLCGSFGLYKLTMKGLEDIPAIIINASLDQHAYEIVQRTSIELDSFITMIERVVA